MKRSCQDTFRRSFLHTGILCESESSRRAKCSLIQGCHRIGRQCPLGKWKENIFKSGTYWSTFTSFWQLLSSGPAFANFKWFQKLATALLQLLPPFTVLTSCWQLLPDLNSFAQLCLNANMIYLQQPELHHSHLWKMLNDYAEVSGAHR